MYFLISFTFLLFTVLCNGDDIPCNKVKTEHGYICVCNSTYCDTISTPKKLPVGQFHFYFTSDHSPGFNHETGHFKMQSFYFYDTKYYEVNISNTFQTIRGFGGAFSDSFGAALNALSYNTQENLIKSFFSGDGIEYTICRVVLGSSDFSVRNYSYVSNYDPSMKTFNLTNDDYIYKISLIKRSLNVTKRKINLFGTTWFSPAWMKINNNISRGYLWPKFRQLWADYHVKILDAYRTEGIEFWAITTGNQPITFYVLNLIPCVIMFPEEQREWIINNLGPALKNANYSTKIIIMDDQRLYAEWYLSTVMRDPKVKEYVAGIGIHWYFDTIVSPSTLDEIHKKFPDQEIFYTESSLNIFILMLTDSNKGGSTGNSGYSPALPKLGLWERAAFYAVNIIQNLQHWVTSFTDWNIGLNIHGGPNVYENTACDASIITNETANEFYKQPIYYILGHFSKFILPGAVIFDIHSVPDSEIFNLQSRFTFTNSSGAPFPALISDFTDVNCVGAANPDGSFTIIFYNLKDLPVHISVHDPKRGNAFLFLEPNSISTLLYW